jgi:CMP-N,N'-diacetyllegionaminic acid synthase
MVAPLKVLGLVPARGGSKGVPGKNIKPMAGKPLLAWTAEAARASRLDRVVLSTDDEAIAAAGRACGLEVPFMRPPELGRDDTPGLDVVVHAVQTLWDAGYRPDAVMLLQPTSPLREASHIDRAIALLEGRPEADSLVSVVRAPHNMIPETLMRLLPDGCLEPVVPWDERKNLRQAKPAYYARNGAAVYLVRTACLLGRKSLYGDRILALEMAKEESLDVDDLIDFELCEYLLRKRSAGAGQPAAAQGR